MPFAISGVPLVPVFHLGAAMGRNAPFWDSRDEFGDTNLLVVKPEEGASLARALGSHSVVVMRRHGATVVGGDLRELVFRTIYSAEERRASARRACARQRRRRSPRARPRWRAQLNLAPGPIRARLRVLGAAARRARRTRQIGCRGARGRSRGARAESDSKQSEKRGEVEEKRKSQRGGNDELLQNIGGRAVRAVVRRSAARAGHAEDRDRADQQLGEPGADARRGRRHLQEAQSEDRSRSARRARARPSRRWCRARPISAPASASPA